MKEAIGALGSTYSQSKQDNLTKVERIAIQELKENPTLVINKADKGSTIVIRDRSDYCQKASIDLSNKEVYLPLTLDITQDLKRGITSRLQKLHSSGLISKEMLDFCTPPMDPRTSRLYYLTKIHKNPHKERPIVASCESTTENISQCVDKWLQPIMRNLPSAIRDTTHFINLIEAQAFDKEVLLASIDVSSLYTNIPHNEGIEICVKALREQANPDPSRPPPEIVGELIRIVLNNNVFTFDEKYYLQVQGTAMGTKLAPAYANIFMSKIETDIQDRAPDRIAFWKRFIDDIFVIWTGSKEEFKKLMEEANSLHETIKFTYEVSESETVFLDTIVYKGRRFESTGILDLRTHIKVTNKQLYVHANSYHPLSVKKAIAKGEATRYLRTNSDEQHFNQMTAKLKDKLQERGYSSSPIDKKIGEVSFGHRGTALAKRHIPDDKPLTFVTRFCDPLPKIREIISEHYQMIREIPGCSRLFPESPVYAYRKNESLKDKLVRARLEPIEDSANTHPGLETTASETRFITDTVAIGTPKRSYPWNLFDHKQRAKKCKQRNCILCDKLTTTGFVTSTALKRKFQIKPGITPMSCDSTRVVYLLQCRRVSCKRQYVGQTTRKLRDRIIDHIQPIHPHPVARHFSGDPHNMSDMTVLPLEKISDEIDAESAEELLQEAETMWIQRLNTRLPRGLNVVVRDTTSRLSGHPINRSTRERTT